MNVINIKFSRLLTGVVSAVLVFLLGTLLVAMWRQQQAAPPTPLLPSQVVARYWQFTESGQPAEAAKYTTDLAGTIGRQDKFHELFAEVTRTMKLRVLKVEGEVVEGDKATVTAEAVSDVFGKSLKLRHDLYKRDGEWRILHIDWKWQVAPVG